MIASLCLAQTTIKKEFDNRVKFSLADESGKTLSGEGYVVPDYTGGTDPKPLLTLCGVIKFQKWYQKDAILEVHFLKGDKNETVYHVFGAEGDRFILLDTNCLTMNPARISRKLIGSRYIDLKFLEIKFDSGLSIRQTDSTDIAVISDSNDSALTSVALFKQFDSWILTVAPEYSDIEQSHLARALENNYEVQYIKDNGDTLGPKYTDGTFDFDFGYLSVVGEDGWGLLDRNGNEILSCKFQDIRVTSRSWVWVRRFIFWYPVSLASK